MHEIDPQQAYLQLLEKLDGLEDVRIILALSSPNDQSAGLSDVAAWVRLPQAVVQDALGRLCKAGLVVMSPEGMLSIDVHDQAAVMGLTKLAEEYEGNRLEVIKIMNANAIERIRARAIRAFARSGVVRGEGP